MTKLRDKFWLWGQDPGSHHASENNVWNLPGVNQMGPVEGAEYLGIPNCCRVVMNGKPVPPFDADSEALKGMNELIWSIIGDSGSKRNDNDGDDLDEVLRQARKYPNITGVVLDDFFAGKNGEARLSVNRLKEIKLKLNSEVPSPLSLWLVYYDLYLDRDYQEYIDLCDVITFWTWQGCELKSLDKNFDKFKNMTPQKRRLAGCYMWNYGESKALSVEDMKLQCEKYYQWLKKGDIDGIIFCSNCIADLGLDTVAWTRNWINEVGCQEIKGTFKKR